MNRLINSGWVQNTVVGIVLASVMAVGALFIKTPKAIIICACIALTVVIWFFGFNLVRHFTEPKKLAIRIYAHGLRGASYSDGQKVGGLTWSAGDIPLKVDITTGDRAVRNLDFKIMVDSGDTSIRQIGQINPISEMTAVPTGQSGLGSNYVKFWGTGIVYGTNNQGAEIPQAVFEMEKGNSISSVWRVRFPSLPRNDTATILIAGWRFPQSKLGTELVSVVDLEGSYEIGEGSVGMSFTKRIGVDHSGSGQNPNDLVFGTTVTHEQLKGAFPFGYTLWHRSQRGNWKREEFGFTNQPPKLDIKLDAQKNEYIGAIPAIVPLTWTTIPGQVRINPIPSAGKNTPQPATTILARENDEPIFVVGWCLPTKEHIQNHPNLLPYMIELQH